jgi:hypothetical protein
MQDPAILLETDLLDIFDRTRVPLGNRFNMELTDDDFLGALEGLRTVQRCPVQRAPSGDSSLEPTTYYRVIGSKEAALAYEMLTSTLLGTLYNVQRTQEPVSFHLYQFILKITDGYYEYEAKQNMPVVYMRPDELDRLTRFLLQASSDVEISEPRPGGPWEGSDELYNYERKLTILPHGGRTNRRFPKRYCFIPKMPLQPGGCQTRRHV